MTPKSMRAIKPGWIGAIGSKTGRRMARILLLLIGIFAALAACADADAPTTVGNDSVTPGAPIDGLVEATEPTDAADAAPAEPTAAIADSRSADADVIAVRVIETAPNVYTFHVTVAHPDTGWDDYADGWDVVLPDGTVIKPRPDDPFTRLLLHPHETEQPFTRSQTGVTIPAGAMQVTVRAHDLVNGFGGREVVVQLDRAEGADYTVERLSEN